MGKSKGDRATWAEISPHKGQRRWQVTIFLDGVRTRTTCDSEAEARRAAATINGQIRRKVINQPTTWAEAEAMLREDRLAAKTLETSFDSTYPARLAAVAKGTGVKNPMRLSFDDGLAHKAVRLAEGRSPATINGEINAIRTLQAFFIRRGWLKKSSWLDVETLEAEARDTILLPHDERQLLWPVSDNYFVRSQQV